MRRRSSSSHAASPRCREGPGWPTVLRRGESARMRKVPIWRLGLRRGLACDAPVKWVEAWQPALRRMLGCRVANTRPSLKRAKRQEAKPDPILNALTKQPGKSHNLTQYWPLKHVARCSQYLSRPEILRSIHYKSPERNAKTFLSEILKMTNGSGNRRNPRRRCLAFFCNDSNHLGNVTCGT